MTGRIIGATIGFDFGQEHLGYPAPELGAESHAQKRSGGLLDVPFELRGRCSLEKVDQEALEAVHAVLGLVVDPRTRVVHHFVGDFVTPMGRQTVQEDGFRIGHRKQRPVDLERVEPPRPGLSFLFLTHRCPDVRIHDMSSLDGLHRVVGDHDVAVGASRFQVLLVAARSPGGSRLSQSFRSWLAPTINE